MQLNFGEIVQILGRETAKNRLDFRDESCQDVSRNALKLCVCNFALRGLHFVGFNYEFEITGHRFNWIGVGLFDRMHCACTSETRRNFKPSLRCEHF